MTQSGDVMQQLPRSASGVSRLPRAASDAKGSSQSQQVRQKSLLNREHLIIQYMVCDEEDLSQRNMEQGGQI